MFGIFNFLSVMSFESHLALAHPEHNNGTTPVKLSEIYVVQKLLL